MPQETKSRPSDVEAEGSAPGVIHENLHGWVPPVATDQEIRSALDKAFDYRGDVTLTLKDGTTLEGFVFDRRSDGAALADCSIRIFPKDGDQKVSMRYSDIARLEFSGRDTAAGKSWETWVEKYHARKAAGETNIRQDPESLEPAAE